jgi:hypothetical protein
LTRKNKQRLFHPDPLDARGARFFLVLHTKTGEIILRRRKIYHDGGKYTK